MALRDLLQQRLWLRDHGDTAPLSQLRRTREDMERSRRTLAENMDKLEAAGEELAAALVRLDHLHVEALLQRPGEPQADVAATGDDDARNGPVPLPFWISAT